LAFFADLLVSAAQYGIRKMRGGAYCAWAYLLLGIFGCAAVLLVSLLPSIPLRRRALHVLGIWLFRLAGVRLEISGLEPIANGAARIITANHASYADVLVLTAALPPVFACVAKKEFARNPAAHFLFARIGTLFVERFSAEESISDAEVMIQAVNQGSTVLIFPEGTFCDASNMLPFKLGAFTTAARTGAAILPVAVSGTRKLLRPEQWFVRRTAVRVTGGTLLKAQDAGWDAVLALRNAAFQEIERLMHRPD
ncbi:MAG TPA: lysophospholipid acyltransferase family protein, partial [Oligoflexia bacterium]|nr:lysophospholipid acyltransferase family protein [Oligoflexia bacterium]